MHDIKFEWALFCDIIERKNYLTIIPMILLGVGALLAYIFTILTDKIILGLSQGIFFNQFNDKLELFVAIRPLVFTLIVFAVYLYLFYSFYMKERAKYLNYY